jgi:hypothetical protein
VKRSHAGFALCSVIAGVVTAAHADQVFVEIQGTQGNVGRGVAVSLADGLTFWDGSTSKVMWAGQRAVAVDGQLVKTYAAEITARAGTGWHEVAAADQSLGAAKARAVQSLFDGASGGRFTRAREAVAFQALLWEIVYDYDGTEGSIDPTAGRISFGAVDHALFDAMKLSALRGGGASVVHVLSSSSYGDQFRIVPLPSAAALAGIGLLGVASRRHRA